MPVVAIKAPMFGPDRTASLRDIAIATGGDVLGPGLGRTVAGATLAQLGRAERVVATRDETTIIGGSRRRGGRPRAQPGDPGGDRVPGLGLRQATSAGCAAACLNGAVAAFRVGLDTQTEQDETRHRI